jgi:hypothetical protein
VGALTFSRVVERRIEGRHRQVSGLTRRSPNHSAAYISNSLRFGEIEDMLEIEPEDFAMVIHLGVHRNPTITDQSHMKITPVISFNRDLLFGVSRCKVWHKPSISRVSPVYEATGVLETPTCNL